MLCVCVDTKGEEFMQLHRTIKQACISSLGEFCGDFIVDGFFSLNQTYSLILSFIWPENCLWCLFVLHTQDNCFLWSVSPLLPYLLHLCNCMINVNMTLFGLLFSGFVYFHYSYIIWHYCLHMFFRWKQKLSELWPFVCYVNLSVGKSSNWLQVKSWEKLHQYREGLLNVETTELAVHKCIQCK